MKKLGFIDEFASKLHDLEASLEIDEKEAFSNIFVMGLPRSGTTLLTQLLYNNTDLYCVNNFMARFWETPLVGAKLSQLTISKTRLQDFHSHYGRTSDIDQPHEFSLFWHKWLKVHNFEKYDPGVAEKLIKWSELSSKIFNLNRVLGGGLVFKPMEFVGFHLYSFMQIFKKSIFIYLERDPLEVSLSILRARKKADTSQWWGSYPPGEIFDSIKNKSLVDQVAHQVCYFKKMYEEKFLDHNQHPQLMRLNYDDLCKSPNKSLSRIGHAVEKTGGDLTVSPVRESLQKVSHRHDGNESQKMEAALKKAHTSY